MRAVARGAPPAAAAVPTLGIDRVVAEPDAWLAGSARVALLTNAASLASDWTPTLDAVRAALGGRLTALLSPEHGFSGFEDDATPIEDRVEPHTGLPIVSLYGARRRPDAATLARFDAVLVDLREVGVRPYTYATTVALLLEAAREADVTVVVADRPALLGGAVDGPALEPSRRSFLGYVDVPFQHGLTLGELARHHAAGLGGAPLRVVPLEGWRRGGATAWAEGGGFVPPSPGLPSANAVALYPGLVLLEGTGLSEGRGTPLPFEVLGGPGLDGWDLARQLRALDLPGLRVRPLAFRPDAGKLAGRACGGVQLHVVDPGRARPLLTLARVLRLLFTQGRIAWTRCDAMPWAQLPGAGEPWFEPVRGLMVDALVGSDDLRRYVEGRLELAELQAGWARAHAAHLERVEGALLYAGAPWPAAAEEGAA